MRYQKHINNIVLLMHILAAQGAIDKVQQLVRQVPAMHSGVFDDTNLRVEDTMILATPLLYTGKK